MQKEGSIQDIEKFDNFTIDLAKVSDRRNNFFMVSARPTTSVSSIDLNTFFMLSN